jgi:hypothetical protein
MIVFNKSIESVLDIFFKGILAIYYRIAIYFCCLTPYKVHQYDDNMCNIISICCIATHASIQKVVTCSREMAILSHKEKKTNTNKIKKY